MGRQNDVRRWGLVCIIAIMLVMLLANELAFGQFMVQPMLIESTLRPGKRAITEIVLQNTGAVNTETIYLTVIELTQAHDAKWEMILPDSDFDTSKLSSCSKWISVMPSSVEVPPVTNVPVKLSITVPPGVRGFYYAAIMARMKQPEGIVGIGLDIRFVIPVLLEIEGRPMRHRVELKDVGMEFSEQTAETLATTLVSLNIANSGGTYSRLKGYARIDGLFAGHSRQITTAEFDTVGIIPGAELTIKSDIGRSLPSGKYKVTGTLFVDGRRVKPVTKQIDFAGDPSIDVVTVDTALLLEPGEVIMDSLPGATRSTAVTVYNTSDEAVNVRVVPTMPPHLDGVAAGPDLRGPDLNCAGWVEVVPAQFALGAGRSQRFLISTRMPNPGKMHAYYYAVLNLLATYPDGQNAGVTKAYVCVANKRVEARYAAVAVRELSLGAMEASKYVVVSRFGNIGNVHFRPRCRATVTTLPEGNIVAKMLLRGKVHSMLPLETRDFSGVLDFSEIPAGKIYRLSAILEYAPGEVASTDRPIRVSLQGNRKVVEIATQDELNRIGIQW
jgi:hypothetical protein